MEKIRLPEELNVLIDHIEEFMSNDNTVKISKHDLLSVLSEDELSHGSIQHYTFKGSMSVILYDITTLPRDFNNTLFTIRGDISLFDVNDIGAALKDVCSNKDMHVRFGVQYDDSSVDCICNVYLFYDGNEK